MDRKRSIGALLILIVVVGAFIVFIGLPLTQTRFHYARQYTSGETRRVSIRIYDFDHTSTNVSVSFLDDPALLYTIDVTQYYPGLYHDVYFYQGAPWDSTLLYVGIHGLGDEQVASIDITLGTGTYYALEMEGHVLNVSMVYDNGAWLRGQDVVVNCREGTLRFTLGENVNFTESGLNVQTVGTTNLILNIDLPSGMNGRISVPYQTDFAYSEMVGWSLTSSGYGNPSIFSTSSTTQPILDIFHDSIGWVRACLHD